MTRFHVHVAVPELAPAIRFYSALFGRQPGIRKEDYAKWELAEPAVNFAISARGRAPGVDHLGFQAADAAEQKTLAARAREADGEGVEQAATTCCYAVSDKYWVTDPAGVPWETFHTLEKARLFKDPEGACCAGGAPVTSCCGAPGEG